MLKAVQQAVLMYTMGIFLLPKIVIYWLNSILKKFWWSSNGDNAKIFWIEQSKLGLTKELGGLGFRDLHSFNITILSKQAWRVLKDPNSLVGKVSEQKYLPNGTFLEAKVGHNSSYA